MSSKREKLIKTGLDLLEQNLRVGEGLLRTEDGLIQLKLSTHPDNLLQIIPNGEYEGLHVAPVKTTPQFLFYVSSVSGDDDNDGTSRFPLRTIKEALKRIPDNSANYTIYLKAGETFLIDSAEIMEDGNPNQVKHQAKVMFNVYGYDGSQWRDRLPDGSWYYGKHTKEFPRPIIVHNLRYVPRNKLNRFAAMQFYDAEYRYIEIHFDLRNKEEDREFWRVNHSYYPFGAFNNLVFIGCWIKIIYHEDKNTTGNIINSGYTHGLFMGNKILFNNSVFDHDANNDYNKETKIMPWLTKSSQCSGLVINHYGDAIGKGKGVLPDRTPLVTGANKRYFFPAIVRNPEIENTFWWNAVDRNAMLVNF